MFKTKFSLTPAWHEFQFSLNKSNVTSSWSKIAKLFTWTREILSRCLTPSTWPNYLEFKLTINLNIADENFVHTKVRQTIMATNFKLSHCIFTNLLRCSWHQCAPPVNQRRQRGVDFKKDLSNVLVGRVLGCWIANVFFELILSKGSDTIFNSVAWVAFGIVCMCVCTSNYENEKYTANIMIFVK